MEQLLCSQVMLLVETAAGGYSSWVTKQYQCTLQQENSVAVKGTDSITLSQASPYIINPVLSGHQALTWENKKWYISLE